MGPSVHHDIDALPDSDSLNLEMAHPTPKECLKIWANSPSAWRETLDLPTYLAESQFLIIAPLARKGGMTMWILADKKLLSDRCPIVCSSESFRKRALVSDDGADGKRRRGYRPRSR